jgi:hypothetical protein
MDRLAFVRSMAMDPQRRERIHPGLPYAVQHLGHTGVVTLTQTWDRAV